MLIDHTDIAQYPQKSQNPSVLHTCFSWQSMTLYQMWMCVCLPQDKFTLNAFHCIFTSNNALTEGGAIYALVGHRIQGLTVVENRIHHSNDIVSYYKFLELLLFFYLTVTTHHLNCNIWSGIDLMSTKLFTKDHTPWSDDAIMAFL